MVERLSFDTTFFIDLQREVRGNSTERALAFLRKHGDAGAFISAVALGELMEGYSDPADPGLRRLIASLQILDIDQQVSRVYAENARRLRMAGRLIGSNDLWIGSCSVRHRLPLVTRNSEHFKRIEQLELIDY